ncbi:2-amino-4-hydroxy-6-hydroxymethyldihydropteridine diphosphokinase [Limnohabitans sp. TS-CS-82]|jgi:2-amino-4-hydroxy-6-hydroxymethyldihydropteridine diphosphokinase|uniref:2-amino-4-hydroxy-6- hydroxymethyldihydropteridine diphosphokinase n=1 Tax=Limnohabitans sp. TS-CS-82 TaxID=2094193 RepID=UPI000CF2607E|nr:2-amino-4-hydroxy-6-hydroxymethyldihydropteridine diphosphokinase [Limnohabitans sp. TS-CS-82]PQA80597.1 2-amino-4-hydroxy-6-hydroxymethyldihydropteridine diphosphokinase [Limnohabitans sp. TS-CS-82]
MSATPVMACVALGANLGDAVATVQQALRDVAALPETRLLKASSLYRSAPYEAQGPDFINAVALVYTQLSPLALLHALQALELQCGRERPFKNAPRTLDLDIIFYGDVSLDTPELTLPHPRWQERAFVLQPLAEVWPERVSAVQLAGVKDQAIQRMA